MVDSGLGVLQHLSQQPRVHGWSLPANRETEIKQSQVPSAQMG